MAGRAKKSKKAGAATPALKRLQEAGVAYAVHEYHHDPDVTAFGLEAAAALRVDPSRVFKTLMADVDEDLVVAVVPVAGHLDLKALAAAVGGKKAAMADIRRAERATGYVVGGIAPIGQKKPHTTVVDVSCLDHKTIFISAGKRGTDIELDPEDLLRLTLGRTAPIGR